MATTKLGLPEITGNMTADVPRDMNALAQAVDNKAGVANGLATLGADGKVPAAQLNVDTSNLATKTEVQAVNTALTSHDGKSASTTQKGHVQLSSATNSTSETLAATPKAVKTAMDRANEAFTSANNGKTVIATAITNKGVSASPTDTFTVLADKVGQIVTGKKWAGGVVTASSSTLLFRTGTNGGGTSSKYYINVSQSFGFIPSFIIAYETVSSQDQTIYNSLLPITNNSYQIILSRDNSGYWLTGDAYVSSSGFRLPVNAGGIKFNWIAIE